MWNEHLKQTSEAAQNILAGLARWRSACERRDQATSGTTEYAAATAEALDLESQFHALSSSDRAALEDTLRLLTLQIPAPFAGMTGRGAYLLTCIHDEALRGLNSTQDARASLRRIRMLTDPAMVNAQRTDSDEPPIKDTRAAVVHQPFDAVFPESPSTGFIWILQAQNDFSAEKTYREPGMPAGHYGTTGTRTFALTPLRPGTFELTFRHAQPWEHGLETKIHTLHVTVRSGHTP